LEEDLPLNVILGVGANTYNYNGISKLYHVKYTMTARYMLTGRAISTLFLIGLSPPVTAFTMNLRPQLLTYNSVDKGKASRLSRGIEYDHKAIGREHLWRGRTYTSGIRSYVVSILCCLLRGFFQ
jgi:hypothetical protein